MQTFQCRCGNRLFFHSTRCVACRLETALCPRCRLVVPLVEDGQGGKRCGNGSCGVWLAFCSNRIAYQVCNGAVEVPAPIKPSESPGQPNGAVTEVGQQLCQFCALTSVVPDLKISGNLEKWRRLEAAKARVLYVVERLGLPITGPGDSTGPRLSFRFMADADEAVPTGHADGCITINLREADPIERERTRVQFGEPQRTLVGHFRHELGHYYWDVLVAPHRLEAFRELFGNEEDPGYDAAKDAYYANGPRPKWQDQYISAYATMHPWEDFAETFGAYLDLVTVIDTAKHFGFTDCDWSDLPTMLREYQSIGVMANEYNRDMGLLDLVPEVFTPAIQKKLEYIHGLRSVAQGQLDRVMPDTNASAAGARPAS